MIDRSTNIQSALRSRQRGFLLNPFRFASGSSDPHWSKVCLLLNGESLTDLSSYGHTITTEGGATISSAEKKFGTRSMSFATAGSINVAAGTEMYLNGAFCVEAWVYLISQVNEYGAIIASQRSSYFAGADLLFAGGSGAPAGVANRLAAGGYSLNTTGGGLATGSVTTGQWYHIALTRDGSTLRIFLDGNMQSSRTFTDAFDLSANGGARIGRNEWDGANGYLHGYVDQVRVTNGEARYTTSFTPPTAPFPNA